MAVKFSGKTYDVMKWIALIALPASSILYTSMAATWGWPYATQIAGTIAAVDVFLGVLLGISVAQYRKNIENPMLILDPKPLISVGWIMWDNVYDLLMWVAQVVLPGLATFYYALALIWALPMADQVVATIMALDTFLGMLIGFSSSQFNKTASFIKVTTPQK